MCIRDSIKAVLNNHLELAAVCDVKPEAMETLLAKHGLEKDTSIRRYTCLLYTSRRECVCRLGCRCCERCCPRSDRGGKPCKALYQKESVKNMQFIDLKAQYRALKDEIDAKIRGVLDSAQFIGGPYVKELEAQLAAFTDRKHCITCANGTDALQIAYMVAGVGAGDAVFCPDMTFISSTEPVSYTHLRR